MKFILFFFFTTLFAFHTNAEDPAVCEERYNLCNQSAIRDFSNVNEQNEAKSSCESTRISCMGIPIPTPRPTDIPANVPIPTPRPTDNNTPPTPTRPEPKVHDIESCLVAFRQKVAACSTAASNSTFKCDPKRQDNDSLNGLQSVIKEMSKAGGAKENCANVGMANSSGYHELDKVRSACDSDLNACKSACSEALSFISTNKDRMFQDCVRNESSRSAYEGEVQDLQRQANEKNTVCSTGAPATNRDNMVNQQGDMNNAVKDANQCQCQLNSSSPDCSNQAGPKECAINPKLPGCELAKINCVSADDTSKQCACFKDPKGKACTGAEGNKKIPNSTEFSAFAGPGGGEAAPGQIAAPFGRGPANNSFSLTDSDIKSLSDNTTKSISGTSGVEAPPSGEENSISSLAPDASSTTAASAGAASGSVESSKETASGKVGGLFESAKSAWGNFFSNGKDSANKNYKEKDPTKKTGKIDPKKWRPRGMVVRGVASDEIGTKYDDIWKVMNKQYKVQDQNKKFILGAEPESE